MPRLVLNIPYASAAVPPPVARRLALSPEDWQLEHWRLIDPVLAEIVKEAAVFERRGQKIEWPVLTYPLSPLVADPWGLWAAELAEEAPPRPAVLPRTTAGRPLDWPVPDADLILNRSVVPYHQDVTAAAKRLLAESPLVLVITLRSFGTQPLPFEKCRKYPRPQAAVGAHPQWTPAGLAELTGKVLKSFHWWPELNWPQAGGACLPEDLAGQPRVKALGLSLRRDLYLDERTGRWKPGAKAVARVLKTLFHLLDQELGRVSRLRLDRRLAPPRAAGPPKPSPILKAGRPLPRL